MEVTRSERIAWIQLRQTPQLGPVRLLRLIRAFGSAESVLGQPAGQLEQAGVPRQVARAVAQRATEAARQEAEQEYARAEQNGIRILLYVEPDYPVNLKSIYAPPPYLYIRGELKSEDRLGVAIVGSRRAGREGIQMAEQLAAALARRGLTIVSGFARGVDSAAHRGALEAGGRTLAVLGNGLSRCYPPENRPLFEKLPEHGALLSELPYEAPPERKNFPSRNRIIAGLCLGVVVVEAPERSGALITARAAMDQNREVFAVPGRVADGRCSGCHQLIKDGAALVENEWDVLQALTGEIERLSEEIGMAALSAPPKTGPAETPLRTQALPRQAPSPAKSARPAFSDEEETLWDVLDTQPVHIDLLCRRSGMEISRVSRVLLGLQLKQLVRQEAGMQFCKTL